MCVRPLHHRDSAQKKSIRRLARDLNKRLSMKIPTLVVIDAEGG
jgi:hypothetical protein